MPGRPRRTAPCTDLRTSNPRAASCDAVSGMAKQQGQDLGGGLTAQLDTRSGTPRVVLSGGITEATDFKPLLSMGNPLVIDLERIERINSLGVRHWFHFVRDAEAAGLDLTFDRVSAVMIQQLGMITNFMGKRSRVTSLFAPYLCTSCNTHDDQLIEVGPGGEVAVTPTKPCSRCKSEMQLDELEDMYQTVSEHLANR